MTDLQNKTALITGGNSGFGYATAKELISRGARVIVTGRRRDAIEAAALELGAIPFVADQGNLEDTELLREAVERDFGKIDILFINAGITGTLDSIEGASAANFDAVMDVNFRGAYFTLSRFIPLLPDGASVVILSSNTAHTHKANSSIYQASKAALNSVAKTAAVELAPRRIRVNIVSPGPHKTEIMKKAGLDESMLKGLDEWLIGAIPLKQIGDPADIAKLVANLSADGSSFITGGGDRGGWRDVVVSAVLMLCADRHIPQRSFRPEINRIIPFADHLRNCLSLKKGTLILTIFMIENDQNLMVFRSI